MGNFTNITIIFDFWSAVFCFITAIVVLVTLKFDKKQGVLVMGMLLTNAVLNVFEALAYFYRGDVSEVAYWMVRISNFIVFFSNIVLLFLISEFQCHIVKKNGGHYAKAERLIPVIIIGISALLLILSRVFGFYYTFNENNEYSRLDSYWIMLALHEVAMVIIMLLTIKNWRFLSLIERIEFLMFEFLPLVGLVIQTYVYGVSITTVVNTVTILLVFLSFELNYANYAVIKERRLLNEVIAAFAQAIDEKDKYTGGHSTRVAKYSVMIAKKMGLNAAKVEEIEQMALLHDIGKIGIPDAIINKDGKLTDEEFAVIKSHPALGGEILSKIHERPELLVGARWHHERYDGRGYPDGKKGIEIPFEARIICMADSYDAMTSNRSYRKYLPQDVVRKEVERCSGSQFDPEIAAIMLSIIDEDIDYVLHE